MANLALAFDILARDRGASKEFDKVGRAAEGAGKSATGFGTMVKGAVGIAAGAVAAAGIGSLFSDSIAEAREAQKVGATTAQIIKATGGAAKVSADQVGALAEAISNKTGVDDEAIQTGANMILTFKNVKNEAGDGAAVFDRATQAAVDLSKAGFGSIDSASVMLGKALNDPLKGLTALGRAGVTFTAQQREQIKALVASGDTLSAQKIILGEVEAQVGGVAAASATMGEKVTTSANNFKEKLGEKLLPLMDSLGQALVEKVIPALEGALDKLSGFGDWIRDNQGLVKGLAVGVGLVGAAVTAHSIALGINSGALKAWLVQSALVQGATKVWAALQWVLNAALSANPIGLVITLIAGLAAGLVMAYQKSETFRNIVDGAFKAIQASARFMWENVLKPVFRVLVNTFLSVAGSIVSGAAYAFGWVPGLGDKLRGAAAKFDEFKEDVNRSLNQVNDEDILVNVKFRNYVTKTGKTSGPPSKSLVYAQGDGPGIGDGPGLDVKPMFPSNRGMVAGFRAGLGSQVNASTSQLMALLEDWQASGGGVGASGARGWKAMWAAVKAALPGATLNSAFRPGSITATGNRSYHGMGRAIDIGPATMKTFEVVRRLFPNATELIFSPAGGRQLWKGRPHMYTGVTRANHFDHVHLAMQRGGLVPGRGRGDRVPALLEPGEYVVSRPQVERAGVGAMDSLNRGGAPEVRYIFQGDVYDVSLLERLRREQVAAARAADFRAGVPA